jgi:hypothetical protein
MSCFNVWVLAFSIEVEPGIWQSRAVSPERWPPHYWRLCACARESNS